MRLLGLHVAAMHRYSRKVTCLEQYSSRSAPIPDRDIFYFQNTPEVTSVQRILPFSLTVLLTYFLYRALEAACAAYASLNLSLLHYVTLTQTRLDFANSVLIETSSSNICKFQRVQNCLARVVLQDYSNSATSLLSQLRWFPVIKRISSKLQQSGASQLLLVRPLPHQPQQFLRSVNQYFVICATLQQHLRTKKLAFPTVPLKSGIALESYSNRNWNTPSRQSTSPIALSAT